MKPIPVTGQLLNVDTIWAGSKERTQSTCAATCYPKCLQGLKDWMGSAYVGCTTVQSIDVLLIPFLRGRDSRQVNASTRFHDYKLREIRQYRFSKEAWDAGSLKG